LWPMPRRPRPGFRFKSAIQCRHFQGRQAVMAALLVIPSAYQSRTNFKPATKAAKSVPGRW
jgi:hypothetical protein